MKPKIFTAKLDSKNFQRPNFLSYKLHQQKLKNVHHNIDNVGPMLHIDTILKLGKLNNALQQFKKITKQNRMLMNRISEIYRSKGKVDCYNEISNVRKKKLSKAVENKASIERQNLIILMRILKAKPSYVTADMLNEWNRKIQPKIKSEAKYELCLPELKANIFQYHELPFFNDTYFSKNQKLIYLKFKAGQTPIGRIILELFPQHAPLGCQAFLNHLFHYQNIQQKFYGQNLTDNKKFPTIHSIYPNLYFKMESLVQLEELEINAERQHNIKGNKPNLAVKFGHNNKLSFVITFRNIPEICQFYTVIGHVIHGFRTLKKVELLGYTHSGKAKQEVAIYEWGSVKRKALEKF